MIATRQRRQKKGSLLPILLPIAAIAMLAVALTWPPSRNFITNGPLHPVAAVFDSIWAGVSRPLTFAYQQQQITDRNVQIKQLNDKLEADRKAAADKDAQVQSLQKQITALQAQPDASASPAPAVPPAGAAAPSAGGAAVAAANPGADALKRTAAQWAQMSPENAAAVAQKLPEGYDAQVFAQMSPDAVGPIMDAMPPAFAAKVVQAGPQAQISAQTSR
jgi:flagellar motility protein MotE (MotC chaperone)